MPHIGGRREEKKAAANQPANSRLCALRNRVDAVDKQAHGLLSVHSIHSIIPSITLTLDPLPSPDLPSLPLSRYFVTPIPPFRN